MTTVDELFQGRTELDGRTVDFVLSMPTYDDLAYFLEGCPTDAEQEQDWLVSRMFRELASFAGEDVLLEDARRLVDHPRVIADVIAARNRLHDEARQHGMMFARCPGCKQTEAEISFMYLMLRLRMSPPPLTTPDGVWLPPPQIGEFSVLGHGTRRGDLPLADQIRFELPSARMGLGTRGRPAGGVMAFAGEQEEEAAWERFWPDGSRTPDDHTWWYTDSVPFRALIRMSAAIARFDRGKAPSPATLQKLPAFDIAYLDLAVIAAQFTDEPPEDKPAPGLVPRPRNLPVTCKSCQTQYLPLI